ncbi:hypothetical protein OG497_37570 [Streptomyces sp. NBC_01242]|uniref:hypothetical protein n=1 Tax=Streptomyces sp. NBC_01242 TaxID=2903795 RepID=UPI002250981E|nr:hypothetical protein [Streptomyces sp. NBC_01242]MCX4799567.1 hypothetical protein [Streptomyces sp. NBC_01242]
MSMSESERRLLLSGTLDTSGVGGGPDEELHNVALAFQLPVPEEMVTVSIEVSGPSEEEGGEQEKAAESEPPARLVDRPKIPVKQTAKKTAAPKKQASSPAKS